MSDETKSPPDWLPSTPAAVLAREFARSGLVVLGPEALGIEEAVHRQVFAAERRLFSAKEAIDAAKVPAILEVLNAPGLVEACNTLVGERWAIVPFTHNTPFASGALDQHWHKDDNGPFNGRKQRHHQALQIEMLYYPQDVLADMGPTATVPYSQYWTFNHEENHDNFAGADHLDFAYQLEGLERVPVSGPHSKYDRAEIEAGTTAHDERMRRAVTELAWPHVAPFEVAPLKAGSVVLYSHNLLHRGNHRRDHHDHWRHAPRFMWRFWLFRTTAPRRQAPPHATAPDEHSNASLGTRATWDYHENWLLGRAAPPPSIIPAEELQTHRETLELTGDQHEPARIGAAYQLAAAVGDNGDALAILRDALHRDRETLRRAATYGLIASGEAATPVFREALDSPVRWLRRAGACGLGAAGKIDAGTVRALTRALLEDDSVYVRSVAADALGQLVRRAVVRRPEVVASAVLALCQSLAREENRLSMDRAQNRSIKFVRPTDTVDVCEGIGMHYGHRPRFEPVRSAVRENALTSLVIACTHGRMALADAYDVAVGALTEVVRTDHNIFCVGSAADALARLGADPQTPHTLRADLDRLLADLPMLCWASLSRSNLRPAPGGQDADLAQV